MSSVLTNRLVGSAILIIAAVVFLPDLLDGQKEVRKDDFKAIPERPEFATVTEPVEISTAQHQAAQQAAAQLPTDPDPQPVDTAAAAADVPLQTSPVTETNTTGAGQQQDLSPAPVNMQPGAEAQTSPAAVPAGTVQTGTMEKPLAVEPQASNSPAVEPVSPPVTESQQHQQAANDAPALATVKPAVTASATQAGPAAFVVKVGSFGKSQNAEQLVSKLKAAGFPAFTRKIRTSQGTEMVSVMVGPELNKAKLETQLPELQALVQIPGLKVIGYQVVENN
jgi:DedD protein